MKRIALVGLILLAISCPALFADTLAFDQNVWSLRPSTINGEPIGPYPMHLNVNGTTSVIDMWCITYQQSPDWNAFAVTIDTQNYGAQAYIISMLSQYNNEIIQWALWAYDNHTLIPNGTTARTFLNQYLTDHPSATWITTALTLANNAYANRLTSGYEVYVDTTGRYQSFIHSVPEPSLILLLGIGFGAVSLGILRRKAKP
jgi:hypothetical protein